IYRTTTPAKKVEHEIILKDGSHRFYELSASLIRDRSGQPIGFRGVVSDITERKQAEEALRESEEKYRTILESIEEGYYEVDLAGNFTFFNNSMCQILGYARDELKSMNYRRYMDKATARKIFQVFNQVFRTGKATKVSGHELTRKDGTTRFAEMSVSLLKDSEGQPTGFQGMVRDVTEHMRLEAKLRQAQKMEAVGTLAGGIAHDFNNILSAIIGYNELARMDLPEDDEVQASLQEVHKASLRAKDLVQQILTFSRQTEQEKKPIHISPIIKEALKLLRSSLPTTIEIHQDLKAESDTVLADPTQIHQVLMNLCANAAHAMQEQGGVLTVSLENMVIDAEFAARRPDLKPGPHIRLNVCDTGHGMDRSVMERIFDPYFTTKEQGEGTGLGLTMVHGIVQDYGGSVSVYSEPRQGSVFHVFLPIFEGEVEAEIEALSPPPMGYERVLFVDDEEALVDTGTQLLERLGYKVTAKTSSLEALEVFKAEPEGFDLVITDQTMPQMTGEKLAQELLSIRPDIPVILCTGFSERLTAEKIKEMGVRALIMKPVVINQLARIIRQVLAQDNEKDT
ncbi:MAG: PAS domain S-box protein, partial [Deltaproteobacteria bacterium]|nr:PAS domain S-box protein [Deltaproteobacteria bacterium]